MIAAELRDFVHLFNARKFFEAHETLEALWRREKGPERKFYQGLIQIAAAFVHFQKGTLSGGRKVLQSAEENLENFRPSWKGLDVDKLLRGAKESLEQNLKPPQIHPL